jgi:hypothetical protein
MSARIYAITSSLIFFLVAVLHLVRLVGQWDIVIDGWQFPMWASVIAIPVAGFLSFVGFRLFQGQQVTLFR